MSSQLPDEPVNEDVAMRLAAHLHLDPAAASVSGGEVWARPVLDVETERWVEAIQAAKELGLTFLDWLTAVDENPEGYRIVAHLWAAERREGLLLRTLLAGIQVSSITEIFPGAAWHERETFEMFGIEFLGHENLRKLLLPDEFGGNPLRKEFVLASRAVKAWPGAKEPGESDKDAASPSAETEGRPARKPAASRRKLLPPGVPETPWPLNPGVKDEES